MTPEIIGTVAIQSPAGRFLSAVQQRVRAGFLIGRPLSRSNYAVVSTAPDRITVRAADWLTAVNIGLNDIELRLSTPGSVHYRVRFWRWAQYVIGLSGVLGLAGVILLLTLDVRTYIAEHGESRLPGLSVDQNVTVVWVIVLFFGLVWPWILIAWHKRPLRKVITRIIHEVDAQAGSA